MFTFIPNENLVIKLNEEEFKKVRAIQKKLEELDDMTERFSRVMMRMSLEVNQARDDFWEEMKVKHKIDERRGLQLDPHKGIMIIEGLSDDALETWTSDIVQ